MSVPILYAGSLYRPQPFVPIPTPASTAPHFVSAEIGNVDNSTVVVTFDRDVQANENDYLFGVAITFNGIPTGMIAGFRQANHAIVRYSLVAAASSTDVLTWAYSGAGFIVGEADSTPLGNVTAQPVTNNVPDPIGAALRADAAVYWRMESAADATGHISDLTNVGSTPFVPGLVGNAASLNGSTQYFTHASNSYLQVGSGSFTICLWINFKSYPVEPATYFFFCKGNVGDEYYIVFAPAADTGRFNFTIAGGDFGYPEITDLTGNRLLNQWYFVTAGYNAATEKIFLRINNEIPYELSVVPGQPATDDPLSIGTYNVGPVRTHADMDEIGIWKRILTTDEFNYLYNSGAGRELFP